MITMKNILALGDCNTLGVGTLQGECYPERTGSRLGISVNNCAYTMATTREGLHLFRDNVDQDTDVILIQFGLVDSYLTFRYAPYVLYYPDNVFRKQYRSIIKKYKKLCRKWGLHSVFGSREVVAPHEYEQNLLTIISASRRATVLLIDTIPHKQEERNTNIKRYNGILNGIAVGHDHVFKVDLYDFFMQNFDTFYLDETHCNSAGHDYITSQIIRTLQ